jgi:uncharacterized RDD family membrane protein YckC
MMAAVEELGVLEVATPELVSFRRRTAGLGSRFLAQLVDVLALGVLLAALWLLVLSLNQLSVLSVELAPLVGVVGSPVVLGGYFLVSEAAWSGQTLGKRLCHLRVVDLRGGPVSVSQAVLRNLFRIVDFLPICYGVGMVAIFWSSRDQRLGDLVAGTLVVRERGAVRLRDLEMEVAGAARPGWRRELSPELRRFVVAYAQRRRQLQAARRAELAGQVEPALRAVLPEVVAAEGELAALERLADEV